MSQKIRFQTITIDAATRTPIPAIVDCDVVTIENTDPDNDATLFDAASGGGSATLYAGSSETYRRRDTAGGNWALNDVILWVQASAGTGPISVKYLLQMRSINRIRVDGETVFTDRLRELLAACEYTLVQYGATISVLGIDGAEFVVDTVDGPLERRLEANLEELHDRFACGVYLKRRAQGNRDPRVLQLTVPPEKAEGVAIATLRAIEQVASQPSWWRRWIGQMSNPTVYRRVKVDIGEDGLGIPAHDYIALGYTGDNLTTVVFKTGGASGTTVATLTLAYTGAQLDSVTKT